MNHHIASYGSVLRAQHTGAHVGHVINAPLTVHTGVIRLRNRYGLFRTPTHEWRDEDVAQRLHAQVERPDPYTYYPSNIISGRNGCRNHGTLTHLIAPFETLSSLCMLVGVS